MIALLLKPVCPEGMQVFLAQVEQGKNNVCEYLRRSAVKLELLALRALNTAPPCRLHRQGQLKLLNLLSFCLKSQLKYQPQIQIIETLITKARKLKNTKNK
jgi:hypothetical protein